MFFTKSLTLRVLNGPGAILITDIFFFELIIEYDFKRLLIADLKEDEIIILFPGSFIIDDET